MSSIYTIVENIQSLLEAQGYTVYDVVEWDKKKVIEQDDSAFPMIFIDEDNEVNNFDEGTTLNYLDQSSTININVVLNTGKSNWRQDVNTELRKIKDIIYTNCDSQHWISWDYSGSQKHQIANSTSDAKVFGGVAINTTVTYEELEIQGVI